MKIEQYIKNLESLAKTYPNAEVVYSVDDEGNAISPVHYQPTIGNYKDGEFNDSSGVEINAICVN